MRRLAEALRSGSGLIAGGRRTLASVLVIVTTLTACSWSSSPEEVTEVPVEETLANLQPAILPDKNRALPNVDIDTLVFTYQEVLKVTDDPELQIRVLQRLAGLEALRGEQRLFEEETVKGQMQLAVDAYRRLLEKHPDHENNDELLYQLSKAHDLQGENPQSMQVLNTLVSGHPESNHYAEAQFRLAENYFSDGDYANAEQAYMEVIKQGEETVHYANALYMHGWSQFKRERYRASLKSFTGVLDIYVPENNDLAALKPGKRELTRDTFRIMSVVFSYLDGPQTIEEVYQTLGERHYVHLLYENLGDLYLEKDRYKDSAETYRSYVENYPQSDQAPVFYASLINAYLEGGFAADVLREKEHYIDFYGIRGDYWASKSDASRDYIRPFLKQYLPELAKHYHAKGQQSTAMIASGKKVLEGKPAKTLSNRDKQTLREELTQQYTKAGRYYREFIDTFPEDEQVPEMYYLLAESNFEAGSFDKAIEAYEIVAYKYTAHPRAAEAGYAAIVAYERLLTTSALVSTDEEKERWQRLKIASQLRFAQGFQQDPRSAAVLTRSAEELLALNEYQHALEAAQQLVRREPPAELDLRKTAWLVIGHSEFELQNYAQAELAYLETLQILPVDDPTRQDITDRLAASAYKQAEAARDNGNLALAAQEFLRVEALAPSSAIATTARIDAANALLEAKDWPAAIMELNRFRSDHPQHPMTSDISAKLVLAYQESEQWGSAADELTTLYRVSSDTATKQESLYQAAELYEKAGDINAAIERYRDYANNYPQPFPIAMEARYKLSELYRETEQPANRRLWLSRMIDADRRAGSQRTERSRYLAVMSSSVLADDSYQRFKSIQLTLPLKQSLKQKKQALNDVLKAYERVASYDVAEYSTLATMRIGEVYRQLSSDLMDSQRPDNLDELALEQYELLLEEQAFPFEEKSIDIHEANVQRSWAGVYDKWVQESFEALKKLLPARYGKEERGGGFSDAIY